MPTNGNALEDLIGSADPDDVLRQVIGDIASTREHAVELKRAFTDLRRSKNNVEFDRLLRRAIAIDIPDLVISLSDKLAGSVGVLDFLSQKRIASVLADDDDAETDDADVDDDADDDDENEDEDLDPADIAEAKEQLVRMREVSQLQYNDLKLLLDCAARDPSSATPETVGARDRMGKALEELDLEIKHITATLDAHDLAQRGSDPNGEVVAPEETSSVSVDEASEATTAPTLTPQPEP